MPPLGSRRYQVVLSGVGLTSTGLCGVSGVNPTVPPALSVKHRQRPAESGSPRPGEAPKAQKGRSEDVAFSVSQAKGSEEQKRVFSPFPHLSEDAPLRVNSALRNCRTRLLTREFFFLNLHLRTHLRILEGQEGGERETSISCLPDDPTRDRTCSRGICCDQGSNPHLCGV